MKRFVTGMCVGLALASSTASAIGYTLSRSRTVTTAQIDAFFQIAVDRGAWPGTAGTVLRLCGERTSTGGRMFVAGTRSGNDAQMTTDQPTPGDAITVP